MNKLNLETTPGYRDTVSGDYWVKIEKDRNELSTLLNLNGMEIKSVHKSYFDSGRFVYASILKSKVENAINSLKKEQRNIDL